MSDRSGKAKAFAEELGIVYSDAETIAARCDRIFIAVKPHMVQEVLLPLQKVLGKRKPLLITMRLAWKLRNWSSSPGRNCPSSASCPTLPRPSAKGSFLTAATRLWRMKR